MKKIHIPNFLRMTPQVPEYSQKNQHNVIAGADPLYYLNSGDQEQQSAPMAASVDWKQISPINLSHYGESNQDADQKLFGAGATIVQYGESFAVTTASVLSLIQAYMKKVDGGSLGSTTAVALIYAHTGTFGVDGTPTGVRIAFSDPITVSDLATSYALTSFIFSGVNKITLAAGTKYFVVISSSGVDTNNCAVVGVDASSPSAPGNAAHSIDGSTWIADATKAMIYYVFTGGTSTVILDGNITHMIPSTDGTYSAYGITDQMHVYGFTATDITDLGYPVGSAQANVGCYLAIGGGGDTAGGYLFASYNVGGAVYKSPLPATSATWTSFGSIQTSSGTHIMEPFLDFVAIKDGSASFTQGGFVKKIDVTAFTISTGINLGAGFGLIQMRNLNNKYLAIAAGKIGVGGAASGYPQNYIFLWDGISSRYNYAVKVPGQFIDMKVIDSELQVAVKLPGGKTTLYYLFSTQLRKSITTQYSTINSNAIRGATLCSLFDFNGYTGIHLNTTSDMSDPILVHGKDEVGDIEFIHSYGRKFDQICPGYDGTLFADQYVAGLSSVIYQLPSTGTYQQLLYKSQWIPVKNLKSIHIYYDSPPAAATDEIDTTIYGVGENILTGSETIVLAAITSSNFLTQKRSILDCSGFTGDKVKLQISTVNPGSWRPIIRAVYLITD